MKKTGAPGNSFRFTSVLERSDNKLWGCHFRVPERILKQFEKDNPRRVICKINDTAEYQTALLSIGNGIYVVRVNTTLRKKLGVTFGDEVQVILKNDESTYGLPMPEELEELLRQDKEGNRLFHAMTRGKQRTLLYIIGGAKNTEKRLQRALVIVRHLKSNNGKINYKQLNKSLKDPRSSM